MGILLGIVILVISVLVPPIIILRSYAVEGWTKAGWFLACLSSTLAPTLIVALGVAVAVRVVGYQRDLSTILLGPEATARTLANITSLILPWLVLVFFKRRYGGTPLDEQGLQSAHTPHDEV